MKREEIEAELDGLEASVKAGTTTLTFALAKAFLDGAYHGAESAQRLDLANEIATLRATYERHR